MQGRGTEIITGDTIQPGALLSPRQGTTHHSITVLLPDGERILYECFTAEDCARGFRVPSLYRKPDPFAVEMMMRIESVLRSDHHGSSTGSEDRHTSRLPRDEVVAVLGPGNRVHVDGLADRLPQGRYSYDLQPLDYRCPRQPRLIVDKTAPSVDFVLPRSGLYRITIADDLNTPRIDLFIAAVKPAQEPSLSESFGKSQALLSEWNEDYQGWPIHDFQRAYLESFMLAVEHMPIATPTSKAKKASSSTAMSDSPPREQIKVTSEPSFSPQPGLFGGDTEVMLRSKTQNAIIRYTVDGSQPTSDSPIYRAPIMVKGTELTIKAFASRPGLKDSANVTGIFRIEQELATKIAR